MHISDGFFNTAWCIGGYAAAVPLVGYALSKVKQKDIPRISVVGAAFFVSSLIHVDVGPSSIHLTLIGIAGLVLGVHSVLAVLTGLFFQAVMFGHGGFTTLGISTCIMGGTAMLAAGGFYVIKKYCTKRNLILSITGSILSFLAVFISAAAIAVLILVSGTEFVRFSQIFTLANLVLALIEGAATFFLVQQLLRVRPDILLREG